MIEFPPAETEHDPFAVEEEPSHAPLDSEVCDHCGQLHNADAGCHALITVIVRRAGHAPEVCEISRTLDTLQEIVGGLISIAPLLDRGDYEVVCNDEFLIEHEPDMIFPSGAHIGGDFIITASTDTSDGREFRSLTPRECDVLMGAICD